MLLVYISNCCFTIQDFTIHSNNVKQQHLASTVNIEEKYGLLTYYQTSFIRSEVEVEVNLWRVTLTFYLRIISVILDFLATYLLFLVIFLTASTQLCVP